MNFFYASCIWNKEIIPVIISTMTMVIPSGPSQGWNHLLLLLHVVQNHDDR